MPQTAFTNISEANTELVYIMGKRCNYILDCFQHSLIYYNYTAFNGQYREVAYKEMVGKTIMTVHT